MPHAERAERLPDYVTGLDSITNSKAETANVALNLVDLQRFTERAEARSTGSNKVERVHLSARYTYAGRWLYEPIGIRHCPVVSSRPGECPPVSIELLAEQKIAGRIKACLGILLAQKTIHEESTISGGRIYSEEWDLSGAGKRSPSDGRRSSCRCIEIRKGKRTARKITTCSYVTCSAPHVQVPAIQVKPSNIG